MARGRGVEHELRVDDVLVTVGVEREHTHAGAELEVDYVDGAADADNEVNRTESAGDGWKDNALLAVVRGPGRGEERHNLVGGRPYCDFDVVGGARVAVEHLTDEVVEAPLLFDQKRHRRMERGAALGIGRCWVQISRHLRDEGDGARAVQNALSEEPPNGE